MTGEESEVLEHAPATRARTSEMMSRRTNPPGSNSRVPAPVSLTVTVRTMPGMRSDATTVDDYLAALPDDRREALEQVRNAILSNLPDGYEEAMNWGMITYQVPLEIEPDTYNGKPLMYAALASQKNHMAVYLMSVYVDDQSAASFKDEYMATGKRMDVGKSCVRFRSLEDLPLDLIGKTIAATPVQDFLDITEEAASRRSR